MVEKKDKQEEKEKDKTCWERWDEQTREKVNVFAESYRQFLTKCKTEREVIKEAVNTAEKAGFKNLPDLDKLKPGSKIYRINKEKELILGVIGKKPLSDGANFIVSHVDSPRLDLKVSPLYEDENIALFKTCYYGGIKKYQWLTLPLALHGLVILKNGKKVEIVAGDKNGDPVFTITDLLPHLAKDQMKKTLEESIPGEILNILIGTIPVGNKEKKERVKANILEILHKEYGITEDDFVSAEIQAVPAGEARELGLDRSMILGYGQDDRVCAYPSLRALLELGKLDKSGFCVLADQEEIGSRGSTSAQSEFFLYFLEEVLKKNSSDKTDLRTLLNNSRGLSADVTCLLDPNYRKSVPAPRSVIIPTLALIKYPAYNSQRTITEYC